ncbi:MAG: translation factor Sua5, partial [Candidatus Magasanikbacteria bacterium]|nr:translation factor Sua5 [Candidatus Magasanikbacteria bacterium]
MMTIVSEQQVVVSDIVQQLKEGTVIVYPTETCYGLGCDATNQDAVDNIFQIKKRQREKTLLVVFPNIDMIKIYVSWTPTLQK